MGNPLNYRNGITMTWERGRLLSTLTNSTATSTATYKYTYDANGIRTSKCTATSDTDSDKYEYYYDDSSSLILYKTPYGDLHFIYDESGSIIGFRYVTDTADKIYSYIKNLQGDIMGIMDNTGTLVAKYNYGVFGGISSVTNGSLTQMCRNCAVRRGIPFQPVVEMTGTGTNADVLARTGHGIATAVVSVPLRYMHSSVECVSLDDVNYTAQLLAAAAEEFDKKPAGIPVYYKGGADLGL